MARKKLIEKSVRKLNPKSREDRRIAKQVDAAVVASSKYYAQRIIETMSLKKEEVRRLFVGIRKVVPETLLIPLDKWQWSDGSGTMIVGCDVHVDACEILAEPCGEDSWLPGCDDQVDCSSEACASAFACAGEHICGENVCSDNTCHSDVFTCASYEVGCTADATQCVVDQPACADETCLIDEPPTFCREDDEGSDCIIHTDECPTEVVSMFASSAWQRVIKDIALKGVSLDKRLNNTTLMVAEDLFNE